MQDSVSVVVPTYNQAPFLAETLESILAQSLSITEVIVVNDGSTDSTEEILRRYRGTISVVTSENRGVSSARNIGLERTETTYVAFCDSDDVWHPDKLAAQMERLRRRNSSQWCLCAVTLIDEFGEPIGEMPVGTEGWVFRPIVQLQPNTLMGGGSGLLVETRLAKALGGFDTSLSTSADWEFYARLSLNSPLSFVAKPLVRYRIHRSGMHMGLESWESDMTRALRGIRERGLISSGAWRRSITSLELQIAGELWRRGSRSAAVRKAAIGATRSPGATFDAVRRKFVRALANSLHDG